MSRKADNPGIAEAIGRRPFADGFTLLEVLTALGILALVSSSVLLVMNRCVSSAADSALRMEAFQLARENLEQILVSDAVEETVEYGMSDEYSDVSWQTVIEGFPDPVTGQMWVRAVCSAEYIDSKGQMQTVELVHWVTQLTDQQAGQLLQDEDLDQLEAEQLVQTVEEAAEYAGVSAETIAQWVEKGLLKTDDGAFIRYNLDLFVEGNGDPTPQEKANQVDSIQALAMKLRSENEGVFDGTEGGSQSDPRTGSSEDQTDKMDAGEVMNLPRERQRVR